MLGGHVAAVTSAGNLEALQALANLQERSQMLVAPLPCPLSSTALPLAALEGNAPVHQRQHTTT